MPELHWTPGPAGTKSYAITFIDVTLAHATPSQPNGYHWVLYNIPPTTTSLPEGFKQADATQLGAKQNSNYLGPCPNLGSSTGTKTDTYEFTIYALAEESITIAGSGTAAVRTRRKSSRRRTWAARSSPARPTPSRLDEAVAAFSVLKHPLECFEKIHREAGRRGRSHESPCLPACLFKFLSPMNANEMRGLSALQPDPGVAGAMSR